MSIEIKWTYFYVNELEVGVNDSIFSGNEQQKVQYPWHAWENELKSTPKFEALATNHTPIVESDISTFGFSAPPGLEIKKLYACDSYISNLRFFGKIALWMAQNQKPKS